MSRALLDVNVLLALFDRDHADHTVARSWLGRELAAGWASCPITENGFVRIISQPQYPSPIAPARAIGLLERARGGGAHRFWDADVSIVDPSSIDRSRLHGPRQVTDAYLLALAVHHGGRLVTFDRSVPVYAVPGASAVDLVVL